MAASFFGSWLPVVEAASGQSCRQPADGGPAIGLALSGGGARGGAHLGVLQVLEEMNIPIGCITGTSMGALVGGMYAAGLSPEEIERELETIDWEVLFRDRAPRRGLSFRRKEDDLRYAAFEAGVKNGKIVLPPSALLSPVFDFLLTTKAMRAAGIHDFDQLPIPFRAVAADVVNAEKVVLAEGDLARAIRASMSIPGIFPPVEVDGRLLVDGGVFDNLPVDLARTMGADIVIAVDAGTRILPRENLQTISGITAQAMSLASIRASEEQKRLADFVIEPDLQAVGPLAFADLGIAVEAGAEAIRKIADELKRFSDATRFDSFLERQRREPVAEPMVLSSRIDGSERVDDRLIFERLESRAGEPFDAERMLQDLYRALEIGEFEAIDFEVARQQEGIDLNLRFRDKSWGPNYLRFGLNLKDDLEGANSLNVLVNLTRTSLNALGAEWRNEYQIGQTRRAFMEFYQPLDFSGRWFVAPTVEHTLSVTDVYADRRRVAEYEVETFIAGADFGLLFSEYGEFRIGLRRGEVLAEPSVGLVSLPNLDINLGGIAARLVIDRLDNANVPRRGLLLTLEGFHAEPDLGSDLSYEKLRASYSKFISRGAHTVLASLDGGSSFGGDLPAYEEFLVGGLFSLSGFGESELRGQYFGVGRAGYLYRLFELPQAFGTAIYFGGWIEAGNVWQTSSDVGDNLIYSATLAAAVDTRLGPIYFAYGRADDDNGRFYLAVGQRF